MNQEINVENHHWDWWKNLDTSWKLAFQNPATDNIDKYDPKQWQLQRILNTKTIFCSGKNLKTLEPLRELKKLEDLICDENNIESLEPLYGLQNLKWISCLNNNLSKSEIRAIKKARPEITIRYKKPLIELKPETLIGIIVLTFLIVWHFFSLHNTWLVFPAALIMVVIGVLSNNS